MRPIHIVNLDNYRLAVLLTRELVLPVRRRVTVAPISTSVRGLAVEVPVGADNGIDHPSVVNCDDLTTVPASTIGRLVGYLRDD